MGMPVISVLFLSNNDLRTLLDMDEVMEVVEEAFREKALGYVDMPPKQYIIFDEYNGDLRIMPAYLRRKGIAGVKIVNVHPNNPRKYNLPTVMAVIELVDPKNGAPLALMDGTLITAYRTGAAGGIAIKYLARRDSEVVAIIGAGTQARTQLLAALRVLENLKEVRIYDIIEEKARKFIKDMGDVIKEKGIRMLAVNSVKEAVEVADIIITVTPSRKPIVMSEWIRSGVHINAIGADAPGKEELDPAILKRAKIVVDDYEQAMHSGEINVPISKGLLSKEEIYAELGEVVSGMKPGRESESEITVFDSTGLAIQDVATAWYVYNKALEKGIGKMIKLM